MSKSKPEDHAPKVDLVAAPPLDPGHEYYQGDIKPGVSRRTLLMGGAAAIMAGVAAGQTIAGGGGSAFGPGAADAATITAAAKKKGQTGTIKDVKHVVILMQENRSFDHYYGTLPGVRGFSDKQMLEYPGGGDIFHQPDLSRTDGGHMLPWPLDSADYNAQNAGGLDHSWGGGHTAWNKGTWNNWVAAKSEQTMGYFTKDDIPFHHTLASSFTIADHYHCSLIGPTTPNRLYQWTGMIDPAGTAGGPATDNPADYNPVYSWSTYPERLQAAGVTWKTYANDEVGDDGSHPYVGDYGDNPLWLFQQYHDALASTDPAVKALAINGGLNTGWLPDSGKGLDVTYLLSEFGKDAAANTLPEVSYVVAPYGWCEHPAASPDYGAHYTNAVIQALMSNPDTWASTVLLINYDENDGYFDHMVPPLAEPGTAAEYVDGLPIGYGTRVPLTVVSPWSRGGWVDSQVFDHTSVIRFLETWTGVTESNISAWRRTISGDLTSCFDFTKPDFSIPTAAEVPPMSATQALVAAADADASKPTIREPALGTQKMPVQDAGTAQHRPLPYRQSADVAVNRSTGAVTLTMRNAGTQGVSHQVFPNAWLAFASTPHTIAAGASATYTWNAAALDGKYDFSVYGPDRFLRRFAGTVVSGTHTDVPLPGATATLVTGRKPSLRLALANGGTPQVTYTLTANDFITKTQTVTVRGGRATDVDWPVDEWGYYDVIVTANTGTGFRYRFAGRVE
ncbi:phospholipase C, phosphocholine-specific [Frondihabitans sp. PAMC 28766]|uniref:phosphocholine-specific phospholipase C n=1 Tax=Frondihabitans sp. PAMC 28766 TaxID=1795630 RepID=UPI00078EE213|nr:phospholipase C, phosphocholine-specific [Frondihabitans sp. PAMC 28766]AMM21367.1 phospholipase C, phosphocholine-specific [Frondihabitans sp. PAMC 28766]